MNIIYYFPNGIKYKIVQIIFETVQYNVYST